MEKTQEKPRAEKNPRMPFKPSEEEESLVRILQTDIPGNKNIYTGLTRIKGVSWSISNAICNILSLDKSKKIKDLNEKDKKVIEEFLSSPKIPEFMMNRRKDLETGKSEHLVGSDLDLKKEFDIKRMKKMKSYRGIRHSTGQPVRGQRTRSHFRQNKSVGVMNKPKADKK